MAAKTAALLFILMFLLQICLTQPCVAQIFQPGFRTLGAFEDDPPLRLDVNIWYPATRQAKELNFPPWSISGALGAKPAEGRFPLLIISHASPADRFAYHNLAEILAREGFMVAAPTHGRDNMNNMDDLFTWAQLTHRIEEISAVIQMVAGQKDLAPILDLQRIGLIGFGSGATAALFMGGAVPACSNWAGYCNRAGKNDAYCSEWAAQRINTLCQNFPLHKSLADTRIKAIAAIAPGFGMLFDSASFVHFRPPLLLVSAGREKFNRARLHCEPLAKYLGSAARFLDLPTADTGGLIAPCSQSLAEELPELCNSLSPAERAAVHKQLADALVAFFSHYLVITANLPVIADPPDLSPEPAPGSGQKPNPVAQPAQKGKSKTK